LIKRAFIDGSSKVVLLVDSSKLTRSAPVRLAGLEEIDVLVTTGPVPKDLLAACTERGAELIVAEESAQLLHLLMPSISSRRVMSRSGAASPADDETPSAGSMCLRDALHAMRILRDGSR